MAKEVIMPVLGMNQEMGTLVEWFVEEGGEITKGAPLMIVATDKTEVEIEATASGVLANVTAHPGDEVPVGSALAVILAPGETITNVAARPVISTPKMAETQDSNVSGAKSGASATLAASPVAARIAAEHNVDLHSVQAKGDRIHKKDVLAHIATQAQTTPSTTNRILASPKARRIAQEMGLDLATINGTGPNRAVLMEDVVAASQRHQTTSVDTVASATSSQEASSVYPLTRAWKVMAHRLQESWQTVPHFYLERNVHATALLDWRKEIQGRFEEKITMTDLLIKVVAAALVQHPRVNASWIDENIVLNEEVNVGLAVAVEDGLLVPVIHQANQLGVAAIATRRSAVVRKALDGQLGLEDMQGGTFTISNLGMFGITKFNAIVNPPQAAILAIGCIEERVVAVNRKAKVRPMMTLTLSCDHRVVDGARGAQFMQTLVGFLENPVSLLD